MRCHVLLQGNLPDPGIELRSPALQADPLPSESPGNPKNTGVDSISLLQGIFPTQESNWGLLRCGQILYQLSYQGSPLWARERANWGLGWEGQVKSTAGLLLWQGECFPDLRSAGRRAVPAMGGPQEGREKAFCVLCWPFSFLQGSPYPSEITGHELMWKMRK